MTPLLGGRRGRDEPGGPEEPVPRLAPDLRLAPAAAASWAGSAWAVAVPSGVAVGGGGLALALAVAVLLLRRAVLLRRVVPPSARRHRPRASGTVTVVVALVCSGGVLLCAGGQLAVREAGLLPRLVEDGATVRVEAVVRADPRSVRSETGRVPAREQLAVRVRVEHVAGRGMSGPSRSPVLVLGSTAWAGLTPGTRVEAVGRLVATDPGDDVVALLVSTRPPVRLAEAPTWQRGAERLRAGLREAAEPLPADAGGLLPGLVVGDTSRLPPRLEEDMRAVGLTHLTAVSGANVAIVCGTVLVLSAAAGARRRLRLVLAAVALAGFVVLARPEPSVLRAAVMGAIGLVGLAASRRGRGMPLLCVSVVVLTAVDPWLSRSFGFALSVLATAALLLLARPVADVLSRVVPRLVAHAVAVPLAAQAVCGPVVVLLSPQVPLLAVPANLLVAPAIAPATVLGVAAAALAPLSMPAAEAAAWVAGVATGWIARVATAAAGVPGAVVAWPGGRGGALLLAGVTAGLLLAGAHVVRAGPGARRVLAAAAGVALAGVLVLAGAAASRWLRSAAWPPPGWRVVACDVGQGDALVLSTGADSAVVVDVGPDAAAVDRCLRTLAVRRVDLLVLTHFHADHVAGLEGVLADRPVSRALVSPLAAPSGQANRAREALAAAGVPTTAVTRGVRGDAGPVRWQVLWPAESTDGGSSEEPEGSAANDASVVLLMESAGLRVLAAGDVEPPAQVGLRRALSAPPNDLVPVDVLKVAHHGSAAQDAALHRLLAPRVALIGAGTRNDYGHPAPATLEMLAATGALVLRTDVGGHLAVGMTEGRLWAATERSSDGDGRLGSWQRDVARQPQRRGATWSRHRWFSSPEPRRSSPTGRSSGCAAWRRTAARTSRW